MSTNLYIPTLPNNTKTRDVPLSIPATHIDWRVGLRRDVNKLAPDEQPGTCDDRKTPPGHGDCRRRIPLLVVPPTPRRCTAASMASPYRPS